jgi:hypothetical protein
LDDDEFERRWLDDEPEQEVPGALHLSGERTVQVIRGVMLIVGAGLAWLCANNLMAPSHSDGLAPLVGWLYIVFALWLYGRLEDRETEKELDKMLGRS